MIAATDNAYALQNRQPEVKDAGLELLSFVEPFTVFPQRWLVFMAALMRKEQYSEDELIFRAGDPSDALYVVQEGEVKIFTDTVGQPVHLMEHVKTGQVFGEVGVLERSKRAVSAMACKDTTVLRLEGSDLTRLGRASRRFGVRLAQRALQHYMRDSTAILELGQRKEVRIRLDHRVSLQTSYGEPIPVMLENLSLSGAGLRDVPEEWQLEDNSRLAFRFGHEAELFQVRARIAWRKKDTVGLAFTRTYWDHEQKIEQALSNLLSQAPAESNEHEN